MITCGLVHFSFLSHLCFLIFGPPYLLLSLHIVKVEEEEEEEGLTCT